MIYIDKVDEQFVLNFVKENLKDVYYENTISVNKYGYISSEWIVSGKAKKYNASLDISLTDFKAVADVEQQSVKISKLWCVALYKKFGNRYMEDLKNAKMSELNAKYQIEKTQLDKELNEIKIQVIKETIK